MPIPIEGIDFPVGQEPSEPDFPDNLFNSQTQTPLRNEIQYAGGGSPAVSNFLVFLTIKDGDVKPAPLLVDVAFGINGELVNQSTFRAKLNNVDVTSQFITMDGSRRRAYFQLGTSMPLKLGKNLLTTTVDGIVPGTKRSATDADRITFTVQ